MVSPDDGRRAQTVVLEESAAAGKGVVTSTFLWPDASATGSKQLI
jgi:hypothetical protein